MSGKTKIPPKKRDRVIARDGGRCVLNLKGCRGVATTADHRANRGAGGSVILNGYACLIAACEPCNGAKEDAHGQTRDDLIARGLRVEKDSTNEKTLARCQTTPVTYPDGSVRWLDDEGGHKEGGND